MPAVCSGVIVSEYELLSRHSTSQSSSSTVEPLNNVRMTRLHFALLSRSRYVNISFRWSSSSPNSAWLTKFCAVAWDEARIHSRAVNSRRIIGALYLVPSPQASGPASVAACSAARALTLLPLDARPRSDGRLCADSPRCNVDASPEAGMLQRQ